MVTKKFLSGDEAVAYGARLARPKVIAAYPITPQTVVVERLADFCEDGSLDARYMHVESEHSAMVAVMGASMTGARTFTATSSQGLLYMVEPVYYAAGCRLPIVMMNGNRATATPWSIYNDQRDTLSQLDSGWLQVYVEDGQEALDMTIQAFKIAENSDVMLPVMVNLDGFVLTHTYELLDIPEQADVDKFLPPYVTDHKMTFEDPKSLAFSVFPDSYTEFKIDQHQATLNSVKQINQVDKEFGDIFGRYYHGMVEEYKCDDAEVVLITLGSVSATTRLVIDKMRAEGKKVGMLKLRYLRPFPTAEILKVASKVKAVGVVEKNLSTGYEGTLYTNVNSALTNLDKLTPSYNFVIGLGGRSIAKSDIEDMFNRLLAAAKGEKQDRVQFLKLGCEE